MCDARRDRVDLESGGDDCSRGGRKGGQKEQQGRMVRSDFYLFEYAIHDILLTRILGLAPARIQNGGAATPPAHWEETARVGRCDIYAALQYKSSFVSQCSMIFEAEPRRGRD